MSEKSFVTSIKDAFGSFARLVNIFAASPSATALAFALVVLWALSGPYFRYSDVWQLIMNTISSVITFLMVFVLNNAQSRDTTAINAKLDSIVFAIKDADNRLIGLESTTESHAQAVMKDIKTSVNESPDYDESTSDSANGALPRATQHGD